MRFFSLQSAALTALVLSASALGFKYERLDRDKAVLAVIDHQVGLMQLVRDYEPNYFFQQVLVHARMARAFDLPVVMTTSADTGPNGPLIQELIDMFPNATLVRRQGEVNAMDSEEFRDALAATNRSQVIVGGIVTEVCTAFAALSMREDGYAVWANTEASGTSNAIIRDAGNQRMRDAGVHIVSPFAIFGELMRDWRTPPTGENVFELLEAMVSNGGMLTRSHNAAISDGVPAG